MVNLYNAPLDGPICVFCGSSLGRNPGYARSAAQLGELRAGQEITLVDAGSNIGLMNLLADAAPAAGGRVVGTFPKALQDLDVAHASLTELYPVESMHQRKALMADVAEALIAVPEGFGTLDEVSEILTLAQLGMHSKPIGLPIVNNYFDPLLSFRERTITVLRIDELISDRSVVGHQHRAGQQRLHRTLFPRINALATSCGSAR